MRGNLEQPVHLYVKTHMTTGLKYFGRTTENPYFYEGSGAYWRRHLDKYGYAAVKTNVVGTYTNASELRAVATAFSKENSIETSTDWANLLPEDGGVAGSGWRADTEHASRIAALDRVIHQRMGPDSRENLTQGPSSSSLRSSSAAKPKGYWNGLIGAVIAIAILAFLFNLWEANQTCVVRDSVTHEIVETGVPCP